MPFLLFQKKYFTAGAYTDTGLARKENQDSYRCLSSGGLFVVSDGMGGGDGGERASAIVVQTLAKAVVTPLKNLSAMVKFSYQANTEIQKFAAANHMRGMGATIVGIVLSPFQPTFAMLFSAGDSRCYRLRKKELELLTTDHTIASAMGVTEEKLAKHLQGVLTNVAGCGPKFFLETQNLDLMDNDLYLLCSDGVSRQIPESEIKQILSSNSLPEQKAKDLITASLKHGGMDNATAIVIAFGKLPEITPDVSREEAETPMTPDGEEEDDVTPPTE